MSVILEANIWDQKIEVEIFHDGTMGFPGYDIQHDFAAHEFGYPETNAMKIYTRWQKMPIHVLVKNLIKRDDWKTMALLLIDWAEHVLPIFERSLDELLKKTNHSKYTTPKQPFGPRLTIELARDFLINARPEDPEFLNKRTALQHAEFEAEYWDTVARQNGFDAAAEAAAASKHAALTASRRQMFVTMMSETVAQYAIEAAEHDSGHGAKEQAWQIRRFVDVMEAVGQDRPWPPMGATP